ncbi:hypothetical protein RhiLY_08183 [Ceratobasidium sp. AG-Ba]|nr:hypothetical protein RhiLY_08183 [Ceratobasidium sp. AG-Ba]
MHLSRICRPRLASFKNAAQLTRNLTGETPAPKKEPRRVPLAKDLGGISLETSGGAGNKQKGYMPRPRDVGESSQIVDQMLSTRLNRRLPVAARTGAGPDRPGSGPRRIPNDRRPQQHPQPLRQQQRSGAPVSRPRNTGARTGMRTGGGAGARPGGKAGVRAGPRPQNRKPRTSTSRSREVNVEPDVPVPAAPIPSRVYDLTNLPTIASPTRSTISSDSGQKTSDISQHVQERVGGEYSRWMSKGDLEAAGDAQANPIARAKLALAFNSSVSPEERKKMLGTAETLLAGAKEVSVPSPSP